MKIQSRHAILAAMAGITNGDFASQIIETGCVGKVSIGGYSIGKEMIEAARESTTRGRIEFTTLLGEEAAEIALELEKISSITDTIVNLRINNPEDATSFARNLSERIPSYPIIEVNAHCRQQEFLERGGGQNLIHRPEVLSRILSIFKSKDFAISLKIRGNSVDSHSLSKMVNNWEIDYLHVDSYRNGVFGTDLNLLTTFVELIQTKVIGNNSVVDLQSANDILETGANYFSIARGVRNNSRIFCSLVKNI
ncbi:MAG: hypothetical protein ACW98I_16630 [Candidatus Hodarchaeales archaeon]|jgi:TIM-barrel protein